MTTIMVGDQEIPKLTACWLTINRSCNMRCEWCYAQDQLSDKDAVMTLSTLEKILTAISSMSISHFILLGGEPTIYENLVPMIKRLKPAKVSLITNAVRLADKPYLSTLKEGGLDAVMVSLKGATDDQYNQNTGVACLDKVEQGIANLNELEIRYSVSVTFSSSLINELPSVLRWMKSVHAGSMSINYCRPFIVDGKVSVGGVPSPREMAKQTMACYSLIRESGVPCAYNFSLPLCLLPREFINTLVANDELSTICQLQRGDGIIFMPDGSLIPCNHLFGYKLGKVGDEFVTSSEFEQYLKGATVSEFYQKTGNLPDKRCQDCTLKLVCGGGCLVQYLHYKPTELVIHPFT